MKPDRESGLAISNLPDPRIESCRYLAYGKTFDCSILRLETQDSLRTFSTGGDPLRKHQKNLDTHDTEQVFGRVDEQETGQFTRSAIQSDEAKNNQQICLSRPFDVTRQVLTG